MARPRLHDEALRARLLEVTSELISLAGADAVTVREVAHRAGTSASAVYTLFGSRDALLGEVVEEGFRRFGAHLAGVARTDDAAADLRALGLAYRTSALADPHFYRVMFERVPERSARVTERPAFIALRDAVARLLEVQGLAEGLAQDAEEIAFGLWAQVHGLVALELAGLLPGSDHERAERYARVLDGAGRAAFG